MQQNKIIEKIIISIFVIALIMFIGGNIVRYVIAYDLFIPGTELRLKDWYSDAIRLNVVHLFAIVSFYIVIEYIVAFISSIILFILKINNLKQYGWLFMAFVLFFLASPIEFYLIYNDIHLIIAMNSNEIHSFANYDIQHYFLFRFVKLSIPDILAFLAIVTSIIMVIWQPLNKKEKHINKEINYNRIEDDKNENAT